MPTPFKQALTISVDGLRSGAAFIADREILAIQFDANLTGTFFYLEGASIADRSGSAGNQPANASFVEIFDSTGTRVQFTRYASKVVVLTEAQRNHFNNGAHYVRIVSSEPQVTNAAVITLIGKSLYQ